MRYLSVLVKKQSPLIQIENIGWKIGNFNFQNKSKLNSFVTGVAIRFDVIQKITALYTVIKPGLYF
jgi:hypothetical protein